MRFERPNRFNLLIERANYQSETIFLVDESLIRLNVLSDKLKIIEILSFQDEKFPGVINF